MFKTINITKKINTEITFFDKTTGVTKLFSNQRSFDYELRCAFFWRFMPNKQNVLQNLNCQNSVRNWFGLCKLIYQFFVFSEAGCQLFRCFCLWVFSWNVCFILYIWFCSTCVEMKLHRFNNDLYSVRNARKKMMRKQN